MQYVLTHVGTGKKERQVGGGGVVLDLTTVTVSAT